MKLAGENLIARFTAVTREMEQEIESWTAEDWSKLQAVHGEEWSSAALVEHVARRGISVVGTIRARLSGSELASEPHRSQGTAGTTAPRAALAMSRSEVLKLLNELDDETVTRLKNEEIDGEPDTIEASCGLIGHWEFHLPQMRGVRVRKR